MTTIDLGADLNNEDDDGLKWGLLSNAVDPQAVQTGAVLRAGTERSWSWVRIVAVDPDGQVHFLPISGAEARQYDRLTATG